MAKPQIDPKLAESIAQDVADMDAGNKVKPEPQKVQKAVCPDCEGSGLLNEFTACERCNRSGYLTVLQ